MNRLKIKYTKICFVIVLSLSLLLSAIPFAPAAEETSPELAGYSYQVEITYGSLSFVYDWGTWNTGTLRYEADDSSKNPANGTEDRFPGWYGFDGTANKITVKYIQPRDAAVNTLSFSLEYGTLKDGISGVSMELFRAADLADANRIDGTNRFDLSIKNEQQLEYWISLKGTPQNGTDAFYSDTLTAIGTLTFRLGSLSKQ